MRKIVMRKCTATQESLPKKDLIRIVRSKEGLVEVDESGRKNGRGAYLKKSKIALQIAQKKNSLGRALECEIPTEIYTQLQTYCIDEE